jgi:hypothetical protein
MATPAAALLLAVLAAPVGAEPSFNLERATAADLPALLARARNDGIAPWAIKLESGHRPPAAKHPLSADVVRAFGEAELTRWIASQSEHLTGKSVDFDFGIANTITNAKAGTFETLPAYRWLRAHAHEFGFDQTFPGEPWHFTHHLPGGSSYRGPPSTVKPGRLGTIVRQTPDIKKADLATYVLTGGAVAWLPAQGTIAYAQCWREEGGGDGCVVKWELRRDRKIVRTFPVFSPGQANTESERRAHIVKAHETLAPLLAGATLLQSCMWGEGAWRVYLPRQELTWDPRRSELVLPGKRPFAVTRLEPWVARPVSFFEDIGLDFAVVELVYDPEAEFTTGANLVSRFEILEGVLPGLTGNWRKGLPKDVIEFVERYGICNHFGGEEVYSPERAREIEAGVKGLYCDLLDRDQRRLRKKYAGKAKALDAIDSASSFDGD